MLQGRNILDITKALNAKDIPTANGKKWLKTAVHTMLGNEAYTRTFKPQGNNRTADHAVFE